MSAAGVSLDALLGGDDPLIHEAGTITWKLDERILRYLDREVGPESSTLETGAGLSTMVFALKGSRHICVVPDRDEVARITAYCGRHGVATDAVEFRIARSEELLPALELPALDLVLIDGCHGFPSPFIDWYYTAPALKVDGVLLVDDTHLWTGRVLARFLRAEPGWERLEPGGPRTEIFRKTAETRPSTEWSEQPFTRRRSRWTIRRYKLRRGLEMLARGEWRELGSRLLPR